MNPVFHERFDVLLSHVAEDAALAEAVRDRLASTGLASWLLPNGLPDEEYTPQLRGALDACRAFVPLYTGASLESKYFLLEAGAAWAAHIPIIPLLANVNHADIPIFFQQFSCYHLWKDYTKFTQAITKLPERVPA